MKSTAEQVMKAVAAIISDKEAMHISPAVATRVELSHALHISVSDVEELAEVLLQSELIVQGPTLNDTYYKLNRTKSTDNMNEFEKVIKEHLESVAAKDPVFETKYKSRGENCASDCCKYIISEVKKSGRCGFADSEIFGMAVHFIDEEIKVPANVPTASVVVNHHSDKPAEKFPATPRKSSVAAPKAKADKTLTPNEKPSGTAQKQPLTAEEVQKRKEEEGCLFFFDEKEGWK